MANDRIMIVCTTCERDTDFPIERGEYLHFVCLSKRFAEWGHGGNPMEEIQEWLKEHTFCGNPADDGVCCGDKPPKHFKIVYESEYQPWMEKPPYGSDGEGDTDDTATT